MPLEFQKFPKKVERNGNLPKRTKLHAKIRERFKLKLL